MLERPPGLDKPCFSMHNARMRHAQQVHITHDVCLVQAYAKINLTLDVLGRRTDGYHELVTVMQTIDLHDTLCLSATNDQQVQLICSQSALSNEENLAMRAALAVRQHIGSTQGIKIELYKRIPMAAGLGGGSSDAAAVLLALHHWWQLNIPPGDLLDIAASLGSDVPFFLTGGLALCEGRGERITPLNAYWPQQMRWLLLLKPAISISTAAAFRQLPASDYTNGTHSRAVCDALQAHKEPQRGDLHNGLERSVLQSYPEVVQAREDMLRAGVPFVRLSGSGPTLFAPFAELAPALHVQRQLQSLGYEVYLSRALTPAGEQIRLF
jgi:4-diphosphocytidyl-2-C-methyl-D-erythritol kinase